MSKKTKKLCSNILSVILLLSILFVIAVAYIPSVPQNAKWAYINKTQSYAQSGNVVGTYKMFGGTNLADSDHNLTICSKYYDASSDSWKYDKKIRVDINTSLNPTSTTHFNAAVSWRVSLKPYGAFLSGCNGEGFIYYS